MESYRRMMPKEERRATFMVVMCSLMVGLVLAMHISHWWLNSDRDLPGDGIREVATWRSSQTSYDRVRACQFRHAYEPVARRWEAPGERVIIAFWDCGEHPPLCVPHGMSREELFEPIPPYWAGGRSFIGVRPTEELLELNEGLDRHCRPRVAEADD